MAYTDILNATSLYGGLLKSNLANTANNLSNITPEYAPVNPYSSGAYAPRSSRNIYTGAGRGATNPVTSYQDQLSGTENLLTKGSTAMQYGSLAKTASPYLDKGMTALTGGGQYYLKDGVTTFVKTGAKAPAGSTLIEGGTGMNLAPAAMVYGMTRDNDPYSYSRTEKLGTTASTMMAANQIATAAGYSGAAAGGSAFLGMNPYVAAGAYLLSRWLNKRGEKKSNRLKNKAFTDWKEGHDEVVANRQEALEENRKDMENQFATQQYLQRQSQYDNQYGGNYDARLYAEEGMKVKGDIIAEFTGNELVVNDQDKIEDALQKKNYSKVATYIKKAMDGGQITPGPGTHQGNPMPVDSEGNIYAGGGALPFKAKKGSGIYDHATDQFKKGMTDKEIAMVVQDNINKWKSNGMA